MRSFEPSSDLTSKQEFDRVTEAHVQAHVQEWLQGPVDEETKATIRALSTNDLAGLRDAFSTTLSFGTGGIRGIMGVGTNRMNRYTIQMATQALANYLARQPKKNAQHKVLIGFDSRHNSALFAEEAARVLAGNGILVYLLTEMRPSSFVSFACLYKQCSAAIMITASHNPAEYNGYKVYWSDGAQVVAPHDLGIMEAADEIRSLEQIHLAPLDHPLIKQIDKLLDPAYLSAISALQLYRDDNRQQGHLLRIVYTSLHGTGITLAPLALASWGFSTVSLVAKQAIPDGNFPTAPSPNPELRSALQMGMDQMLETHSDLLLANDPDADRLGVAILHEKEAAILSGNEVAALCVEHICTALTESGTLPSEGTFVKTIVTSDILKIIASSYGCRCIDVLTGFKYIGAEIPKLTSAKEGCQFLFGAEESCGYLLGTVARDKDGISTACLLAEMALQAKLRGITLIDRLHQIYRKYGVFRDKQLSLEQEPAASKALMRRLREHPLTHFCSRAIACVEDYSSGTRRQASRQEPLPLPPSNVLLLLFKTGEKLVIRPSGTEAKLKIYASLLMPPATETDIPRAIAKADLQLNALLEEARAELLSP